VARCRVRILHNNNATDYLQSFFLSVDPLSFPISRTGDDQCGEPTVPASDPATQSAVLGTDPLMTNTLLAKSAPRVEYSSDDIEVSPL
jgi:hypothetical protein